MKHSSAHNSKHGSSTAMVLGLFAIAFTVVGFVQITSAVHTERVFSSSQVLGDSSEEKSHEVEKQQQEQQHEQEKVQIEKEKEKAPEKKESEKTQVHIQSTETEIQTASGLKVKTKIEDSGSRKVEIEQNNLKLKMEQHTDQDGTSSAKTEQEISIQNDQADENTLHIATDSGNPSLLRRNIRAKSDFPLSIDPTTNTLMVTTPAGVKAVTVLPDQAVENLLGKGFISTSSATQSLVNNNSSQVKLTLRDGKPVYEVQAQKNYKIFGIFPVQTPTALTVSAEDGQIISQERSLLTGIIDFLSP